MHHLLQDDAGLVIVDPAFPGTHIVIDANQRLRLIFLVEPELFFVQSIDDGAAVGTLHSCLVN